MFAKKPLEIARRCKSDVAVSSGPGQLTADLTTYSVLCSLEGTGQT